jgi:hypothetical protein
VASFQSLYETLEHTTQELNDTYIETSAGAHTMGAKSIVAFSGKNFETRKNCLTLHFNCSRSE